MSTRSGTRPASARSVEAKRGHKSQAEKSLSVLGRLGLAGRTGFYLILVALTVRIAMLGGASGHQADAHGALALVSRPLVGKIAIAAVALGFLLFGAGRLLGAVKDRSASWNHRVLTVLQGLFYVALAYVPSSFLAGRRQSGSQQQQQRTTGELLHLPGGRAIVIVAGIIVMVVCAQQIRGALRGDFRDGLDMRGAPRFVPVVAQAGGVVGIIARALVFAPIGVFLIIAAARYDPSKSYGTDQELLHLSGHTWGVALLAVIAAGLGVFVVYSAIETRYRRVVSAE